MRCEPVPGRVRELIDGRKQTHWMWFIFPQLSDLGHSAMAQRYAIRDMDHLYALPDPLRNSSSNWSAI
jgi:uncharacterized protein (DUF1810 family)